MTFLLRFYGEQNGTNLVRLWKDFGTTLSGYCLLEKLLVIILYDERLGEWQAVLELGFLLPECRA